MSKPKEGFSFIESKNKFINNSKEYRKLNLAKSVE
jgi:hypothetical protein